MDEFYDRLTEDDIDDLGCLDELPQYFKENVGPAGDVATMKAFDRGLGYMAAMISGHAAHAATWKRSEDDFRAEILARPNAAAQLFALARDCLEREDLWPWSEADHG
jgi:hypothetical protein